MSGLSGFVGDLRRIRNKCTPVLQLSDGLLMHFPKISKTLARWILLSTAFLIIFVAKSSGLSVTMVRRSNRLLVKLGHCVNCLVKHRIRI